MTILPLPWNAVSHPRLLYTTRLQLSATDLSASFVTLTTQATPHVYLQPYCSTIHFPTPCSADETQKQPRCPIALPSGLPGHIFRSPMPCGPYDPQGAVLSRLRQEHVAVIVLLASDAECIHKAERYLRTLYEQEGWQVLHLPIPDFGVPARSDMAQGVQSTIEQARAGLAHCDALLSGHWPDRTVHRLSRQARTRFVWRRGQRVDSTLYSRSCRDPGAATTGDGH